MTKFRLIAVSLFLTAIFIGSAFAQTQPGAKIGVINPDFFEADKGGITKLVNALNAVDAEFKPRQLELQALRDKMNTVAKEGQDMQKAFELNPKGPIGATQIQAKADEFEKMQVEFKRKQEDAGNAFNRRLQQATAGIYAEIGKALDEYVKQKGYTVLLDARPFARTQENPNGISIYFYVDEKADITADFITFCNAKLAAPTAATKPPTPAPKP
jgi:Skp family chaperone for outer membrane proteins